MTIKNIVLHHIIRKDNEDPILKTTDKLLPQDDTITDFMSQLIENFSAKHPTYGTFREDIKAYPFQTLVKKYLNESDFLAFSIEAMKLLKKEINVPKAKGGYVVFAHILNRGQEFLYTIMLDKSEQYSIDDESLDIEKLLTLDLERLSRANRVNLSKWPNEEDDELYLAFFKGKRDVSNFFQKFIGNTDLTSSKKNCKNLKEATYLYMRKHNYSDDDKEKVSRNLYYYFDRQFRLEDDIHLEAVSAYVNTSDPKSFLNFVNSEESVSVSGVFRASRKSDFQIFHKSVIIGNGYKLEFEKDLVKQGIIKRKDNDIIIKGVPKEIIDKEFDGLSES